MALKANYPDGAPGTLEVVLARRPLFFREINPQPRKHTLWQSNIRFYWRTSKCAQVPTYEWQSLLLLINRMDCLLVASLENGEKILAAMNKKQEEEKTKRVATLDASRGLTIMLMILVDDAGGAYPWIDHSPWNRWCVRLVKEHLNWETKSELKAEVLHSIKEIGSVLYWMGLGAFDV
ncbi:hypothetical protein PIB30_086835 [Stylosanthes scabra]|uniref:TRF2/HOY1 PH-like domain-containing protein n=1 Tax=Stylosanthes scabra TaxID=79078 RepID=A0ABU6RTS1_9FABA|nr:hypothetical protein [Stylosanthes scabra]